MSRITKLAFALALVTLPVSGLARAADVPSLEETLAASASTPAQHKALAAYYRGKAEEAKKEAANHRAMGVAYSGRKDMASMKEHCDKLAALQEDVATQYTTLADMEASAGK